MNENDSHKAFRSRDALFLKMLGGFFAVFGILVWCGLFWEQPMEGRVVNIIAGFVLVIAAAISYALGRVTKARADREER